MLFRSNLKDRKLNEYDFVTECMASHQLAITDKVSYESSSDLGESHDKLLNEKLSVLLEEARTEWEKQV